MNPNSKKPTVFWRTEPVDGASRLLSADPLFYLVFYRGWSYEVCPVIEIEPERVRLLFDHYTRRTPTKDVWVSFPKRHAKISNEWDALALSRQLNKRRSDWNARIDKLKAEAEADLFGFMNEYKEAHNER